MCTKLRVYLTSPVRRAGILLAMDAVTSLLLMDEMRWKYSSSMLSVTSVALLLKMCAWKALGNLGTIKEVCSFVSFAIYLWGEEQRGKKKRAISKWFLWLEKSLSLKLLPIKHLITPRALPTAFSLIGVLLWFLSVLTVEFLNIFKTPLVMSFKKQWQLSVDAG